MMDIRLVVFLRSLLEDDTLGVTENEVEMNQGWKSRAINIEKLKIKKKQSWNSNFNTNRLCPKDYPTQSCKNCLSGATPNTKILTRT